MNIGESAEPFSATPAPSVEFRRTGVFSGSANSRQSSLFPSSPLKTPNKTIDVDLSEYHLSEKNSTLIRSGYKPHGVFFKDEEQYVVYKGKGDGYSYFHKILALDGSTTIQQNTPTAKHMETCQKF